MSGNVKVNSKLTSKSKRATEIGDEDDDESPTLVAKRPRRFAISDDEEDQAVRPTKARGASAAQATPQGKQPKRAQCGPSVGSGSKPAKAQASAGPPSGEKGQASRGRRAKPADVAAADYMAAFRLADEQSLFFGDQWKVQQRSLQRYSVQARGGGYRVGRATLRKRSPRSVRALACRASTVEATQCFLILGPWSAVGVSTARVA